MKGGAKTYCDRLDLTIDYTNGSPEDIFSVMCRKQAIDYSDENFGLTDRDEVFSDVINYRLGRKGKQTTATLTIPVFGELEVKEELILKGNRGFTSATDSMKKDGSVIDYKSKTLRNAYCVDVLLNCISRLLSSFFFVFFS